MSMWNVNLERKKIKVNGHAVKLLIVRPKEQREKAPVLVWFHGGGYVLGNEWLVFMGQAIGLVERFGVVLVSVGYRLAPLHPYPAALEDCYGSLLYVRQNAVNLNIDPDKIMIGGESAGGGLTAAVAILARDRRQVDIKCMMPLYPMIDNLDTPSSRDNRNKVWNTKRNHWGWRMYLQNRAKDVVSPYAAPARLQDYTGLPRAYTFVCTGEPFLDETLAWFDKLKAAGVAADIDVYPGLYHAFDMLEPRRQESVLATQRLQAWFAKALEWLDEEKEAA